MPVPMQTNDRGVGPGGKDDFFRPGVGTDPRSFAEKNYPKRDRFDILKFKMKQWWFVGISLLWLGCSATSPDVVVQNEFFQAEGKRILIQHFDFNPMMATEVHKPSVAKFGETLSLDIQQYLRLAHIGNSLVIAPGEPAQGDILIQGAITHLAGGNQKHRMFFELFGFGATNVRVEGQVINLATSKRILTFSLSKHSHYTWLENEKAVRENIREIAREIARAFIESSQ